MHVDSFRIYNFRKLNAVAVDLEDDITVLVGANNSGKSSAMDCVKHFTSNGPFDLADLPIAILDKLEEVGHSWSNTEPTTERPVEVAWSNLLPALDIWISVSETEATDVASLLPLLPLLEEFNGSVGVRYRLHPRDAERLKVEFQDALTSATTMRNRAEELSQEGVQFWPTGLVDFLRKDFARYFEIQHFALNPSLKDLADNATQIDGSRLFEEIPDSHEPLPSDPLNDLLVVDYIGAQRFGEETQREAATLSQLMDRFYQSFLHDGAALRDDDVKALAASLKAQGAFDTVLATAFRESLEEIRTVGYPGVGNPELVIRTAVELGNTLTHKSVLKYAPSGSSPAYGELPEQLNGLGYRNLVLMMFRLMSFRLRRMQGDPTNRAKIPPLHLVLLEEPEAHLHPQVQQVFIKHAYKALRKSASNKSAQLLVSTHSSHLTHETGFGAIRYFRRPSAKRPRGEVVSLASTFGDGDETKRFIERYLKLHHSNALFADALVLVEGNAERILVPHFIQEHFRGLASNYIEIVEIGGAHAHRLRDLVEILDIPTLVITDLDAKDPFEGGRQVPPKRDAGHQTTNTSLTNWLGAPADLDQLFSFESDLFAHSGVTSNENATIYFAHQTPGQYAWGKSLEEAIASTFEDALAFSNLDAFKVGEHTGFAKKIQTAIELHGDAEIAGLSECLFEALGDADKSAFALNVLISMPTIKVPDYICQGLSWLERRLNQLPIIKSVQVEKIGTDMLAGKGDAVPEPGSELAVTDTRDLSGGSTKEPAGSEVDK